MSAEKFEVKGEFIKLDALLKATGLAVTGGAAKEMIASGAVSVNGQKETRRIERHSGLPHGCAGNGVRPRWILRRQRG